MQVINKYWKWHGNEIRQIILDIYIYIYYVYVIILEESTLVNSSNNKSSLGIIYYKNETTTKSVLYDDLHTMKTDLNLSVNLILIDA
jgi:hypothetical protein